MRFEVMRLDDVDGTPVDTTVVDAASVNRIVQQAAAIGQRLWIRPAEPSALRTGPCGSRWRGCRRRCRTP
ncbi:hypothetical protein ACWEDZ_40875, partial [Streptomyces sp. NPDC005047]